jgi:hypothetical protein
MSDDVGWFRQDDISFIDKSTKADKCEVDCVDLMCKTWRPPGSFVYCINFSEDLSKYRGDKCKRNRECYKFNVRISKEDWEQIKTNILDRKNRELREFHMR